MRELSGIINRLVTEKLLGVGNVPVPAGVVGDAEKNEKPYIGFDRFGEELREIFWAALFAQKTGGRRKQIGVKSLKPGQQEKKDNKGEVIKRKSQRLNSTHM